MNIDRKMTLAELKATKEAVWFIHGLLEESTGSEFYRSPDLQHAIHEVNQIAMRLTYRFDNQKRRERELEYGDASEAAR